MTILNSLLLLLIVITASPLLPLSICTAVPTTAAGAAASLATQICRHASNFTFCRDVIFSDPRAAEADGYLLSTMAFRRAFSTAADTPKYIELKLKAPEAGGGGQLQAGLRNCLGYYREAVGSLVEAMGNLDSDTFYGLDKSAADVDGSARACKASAVGSYLYDVVERTEELISVANVCGAVSKLHNYV